MKRCYVLYSTVQHQYLVKFCLHSTHQIHTLTQWLIFHSGAIFHIQTVVSTSQVQKLLTKLATMQACLLSSQSILFSSLIHWTLTSINTGLFINFLYLRLLHFYFDHWQSHTCIQGRVYITTCAGCSAV